MTMKTTAPSTGPVDYRSASNNLCIQCQGNLIRTPRRPIDHCISLVMPVHRYRCSRFGCQWIGNVRVADEQ
jgi:hypothetical protein